MNNSFRYVLKKWEAKKKEKEYSLMLENSEKILKKIFAVRSIVLKRDNDFKRFKRKK
ncbi:MAG: hypothetical protein IKF52_07260 [Clostridia bacterium]|nr:hypothetical protein [Clostridia bacterium]